MSALFTVWEPPSTVQERRAATTPPRYPESGRFDFAAHEHDVDGLGRANIADPYLTWVQHVEKCWLTQRYVYRIYGREFGIDWQGALALDGPAQQRAALDREIRRALTALPGTRAVEAIAFRQVADVLYITCDVVPFEGAPLPLERSIG